MTEQCIHCLKDLDKNSKSKDHVFPSSWYTNDTPANIQRWTVPSCLSCNNRFGKLEKDLFVRLAICIDPQQAEAAGITRKLMRTFGVGPDTGDLTNEEKEIRKKLLEEVLKDSFPYEDGIRSFPGFGPHDGFPPEMQRAIKIPVDLLTPVLEKIYKGVEYKLANGRYITNPDKLKVYHVDEEPEEVSALINKFAKDASLGPGFKIFRVASDQTTIVLYKAIIWGKWISYASLDLL